MIEINKIYCENNFVTMGNMPDAFVDLVVTSPPYDNMRDYNGYSFEFEKVALELFRVIKMGGGYWYGLSQMQLLMAAKH